MGAQKLSSPSIESCLEFSKSIETLVATGNKTMAAREDLDELVGAKNHEMAENNNGNFARFMESMFIEYDALTFVETVLWVFKAYRSHGFKTTYWAANLDIWMKMLEKELSKEAFAELSPFYNWLIVNIPLFVKITDESLSAGTVYDKSDIAARNILEGQNDDNRDPLSNIPAKLFPRE